jgi:GH24 family phage-related lysozyme (muramidase)
MAMDPSPYLSDLCAHEGCTTWLYCDTRGFVTIGIGHLVSTASDAVALPLKRPDGSDGTDFEKAAAWEAARAAYDDEEPEPATSYEGCSDLRISTDFAHGILAAQLTGTFLPALASMFPDFAAFTTQARRALVDMIYNLGAGGLGRFPTLIRACNVRDWATAAQQCHRRGGSQARNDWTRSMFEAAGKA